MNQWMLGLIWMFISGCLFAQADSNLNDQPKQGILELPKDIAVYVTAPDGTKQLIEPEDGRALLPAGTYRVQYWEYRKKDAEGNLWRLRGYSSPIKSFTIGEQPTLLDIKPEPVNASISVQASKGYLFQLKLTDPSGATVYLYKNGESSPPPPLVITNQDKSFSVSLTGKYG